MLEFEDLPDEILVKILLFLSLEERNQVRLTSKRLLVLCNSACFLKHEVMCVLYIDELNEVKRSHWNVVIQDMNCSEETGEMEMSLEFWNNHGSSVRSITMCIVDLRDPVCYDIFNLCPAIEHLSLSTNGFANETPWWYEEQVHEKVAKISPNFERLARLELSLKDRKAGEVVFKLTKTVPNLKHLTFKNFPRQINDSLEKAIMSLIVRQAYTLESLSFVDDQFVTSSFFESILERIGPQLTGLQISFCPALEEFSLELVAEKFPNLENLNLARNYTSIDISAHPFSTFKNLKIISLKKFNIDLSDEIIASLAELTELRSLDLTECKGFSIEGLVNSFGPQRDNSKLVDFRISKATNSLLILILPGFSNLRCLSLSKSPGIGPKGLSAIATNCKSLRVLSLPDCIKLNNSTTPISLNCLPELIYLNLMGSNGMKDGILERLELPKLQKLWLSSANFTENSLQKLVVNCPSLKTVDYDQNIQDLKESIKYPRSSSKYLIFRDLSFRFDESIFDNESGASMGQSQSYHNFKTCLKQN